MRFPVRPRRAAILVVVFFIVYYSQLPSSGPASLKAASLKAADDEQIRNRAEHSRAVDGSTAMGLLEPLEDIDGELRQADDIGADEEDRHVNGKNANDKSSLNGEEATAHQHSDGRGDSSISTTWHTTAVSEGEQDGDSTMGSDTKAASTSSYDPNIRGYEHPTWKKVTARDALAATHCSNATWDRRILRKPCAGVKHQPRAAICLTGQLRAFPISYSNLQLQLLDNLYDPAPTQHADGPLPRDIFYVGPVDELFREFGNYLLSLPTLKTMYLYNRNVQFRDFNHSRTNVAAIVKSNKSDPASPYILSDTALEKIIRFVAAGDPGFPAEAPFINPVFGTGLSREQRSVTLQRYQAVKCAHMIKDVEKQEGIKYHAILRSRADIWLHEPVNLPLRLDRMAYYPMSNKCIGPNKLHTHDLIEYGARHTMMQELMTVDRFVVAHARTVQQHYNDCHAHKLQCNETASSMSTEMKFLVNMLIYEALTQKWVCHNTSSPSAAVILIESPPAKEVEIGICKTRSHFKSEIAYGEYLKGVLNEEDSVEFLRPGSGMQRHPSWSQDLAVFVSYDDDDTAKGVQIRLDLGSDPIRWVPWGQIAVQASQTCISTKAKARLKIDEARSKSEMQERKREMAMAKLERAKNLKEVLARKARGEDVHDELQELSLNENEEQEWIMQEEEKTVPPVQINLYIGYVRSSSRDACWFTALEQPPPEVISLNHTKRLHRYANTHLHLADQVGRDCLGWRKTSQMGGQPLRPGDIPCMNITYDNMFGYVRNASIDDPSRGGW